MNNKALTAVTVILGLIGLFAIGYFAVLGFAEKAIEKAMNSRHKKQFVAENVRINSEWTEITPDKLLEPEKQVQNIQLLIEGYKFDIHNPDFGDITLSDGTKTTPELEIVDENGKIYKLKESSRAGDLIGFSVDDKIHDSPAFPKNVKYKTIRIRSDDVSFRCKKIIWHDFDMK